MSLTLPLGIADVQTRAHAASWDATDACWDDTVPAGPMLQGSVLSFRASCLTGCYAQVRMMVATRTRPLQGIPTPFIGSLL